MGGATGASRLRALAGLLLLAFASGFPGAARAPAPADPFADWAAVVVAADWRASGGGATHAFDNARRDVAAALVGSGFRARNLRTYSVEPAGRAGVEETDPRTVRAGLVDLTRRAREGCLVYFTSHGSPEGIVFGRRASLPPSALRQLLERSCGARPTVVIVSACFSGVYIPAVAAPNRLILTAARADRASFGCGVDDVHPVYDACLLSAWPTAADFLELGRAAQACVARREAELGLQPASEPQISLGEHWRTWLPRAPLHAPANAG